MALRLVRETSETPNITNKDDSIMTRYAYGGYNGIVKGFGNECEYTAEAGVFKILDGKIVIDGWEIDVDGAGWTLDLSSVTGTQYHSIYAEISVVTELVKIDSRFLTGSYPEIDKGDDLTQVLNGTARLLLYEVQVVSGEIKEVVKKVEVIPYLKSKVLDIEKRLDELGFKEASVEKGEITLNDDWTDAVPSYFFGNIVSYTDPYLRVEKIGKLAHIDKIEVATHTAATASSSSVNVNGSIAFLPQPFRPSSNVSAVGVLTYRVTSLIGASEAVSRVSITIDPSGEIYVNGSDSASTPVITSTYPAVLTVINIGWNLP